MRTKNTDTPRILLPVPPSFLYPLGSAYVAATLEKGAYSYEIYGFFYDNSAWHRYSEVAFDEDSFTREFCREYDLIGNSAKEIRRHMEQGRHRQYS